MAKALVLGLALARLATGYVIEELSFGHKNTISPDRINIPNFHLSAKGYTPEILSDKVILTPPGPGHVSASLWTSKPLTQPDWTVDFSFRASGPEHSGGHLTLWLTAEDESSIGTQTLYDVGKFTGLALLIDTPGGSVGQVRGYLNDHSIDYRQRDIASLPFGHCDYAYRNLGRASKIQIRHDSSGLSVRVDDKECFSGANVRVPSGYYLGVTSATEEFPDSFEVFKFETSTTEAVQREMPRANSLPPLGQAQEQQQQQQVIQQTQNQNQNTAQKQTGGGMTSNSRNWLSNPISFPEDILASSIRSQEAQFADVHDRLQDMGHAMLNLNERLSLIQSDTSSSLSRLSKLDRLDSALTLSDLQQLFNKLDGLARDVADSKSQIAEIKKSLGTGHESLLQSVNRHASVAQEALNLKSLNGKDGGVSTVYVIFSILAVQVVLVGAWWGYKARLARAPKKYL